MKCKKKVGKNPHISNSKTRKEKKKESLNLDQATAVNVRARVPDSFSLFLSYKNNNSNTLKLNQHPIGFPSGPLLLLFHVHQRFACRFPFGFEQTLSCVALVAALIQSILQSVTLMLYAGCWMLSACR